MFCFVVILSLRFVFPERAVTKTPMRKTNGGCHIGFYTRLVTVWRDLGKEEVPTVEAWKWLRMTVGRRE